MLFKDYHIPMIRSGSKTVTRREWAENYSGPNVGTVVAAKTELLKPDAECDCFIRITGKREEPLGEITEESARAEGDYDGVADFREGYEQVYGEGSWDPEKVVTVVEFEYVGKQRPETEPEQKQLLTDGGRVEHNAETPHRPPCEAVDHMDPHPPTADFGPEWNGPELERRVCPNCRLYFDVGAQTEKVFCSDACRRRHERGVYCG